MPIFDTPSPIDADLDVSIGHVDMIASERADTLVEITPTNRDRSGDASLARESTVSFEHGRLRIRVPRRLNLFGQSDSVDVRIELPSGSRADIESAYGSVRIRGELDATRIVAKYGNVSADRLGDLVLVAPYGSVDIGEVDGRLDATVGHGQLRITRVTGDARLRGSHGVIDLGTVEGAIDASTSGPLTIGRALGDVTARSAHGAIRVLEAEGGILRLENGYAEVEVGVPAGVAAWVDAASAHGAVRNELTPSPEAAPSDRTAELHLRTNWADILIRRATSRNGARA
jgi:hypothetical protein